MSNVPHPVAVKTFIWPAFFLIASVFCLLSAPAANADNITPQWVKIYNDPNNDYDVGIALAVDGDGNVVIGGRVYSLASSYDFYVAKYAVNTGTLIWEKYYDGPTHSDDEMSNMVLDADGNVFVTGSSFAQRGLADYYTAKYAAADGALLWEKRTDRGASSVNYPGTLAADANGNVVVTGASSATFGTNQYDFYTIKYSGTDGSVLWEKVYDGPNHGQEGVQAMAIDIHGDVIVAGGSQVSPVPPGSQADVVLETIKYSGADGSVLWEKRQSAPSGNFESATGMVIAPNGDVLTLAMTNSLQAGFDFYTARYAGTTGALLWEKSYNSPGNGTDFPGSIKSDSAGNAIVTGMADANGSADMYTVKYAVANGAVIWEKRYDGPTHQADSGSSILIDSSDNVIVVGSSGIAQGKGDVQIVKFAAATGVLMLDKGYNGPGNPIEYGGASAFTPDGGIAVLGGIEKIDGNHAVNDIFTIKFLPGTATEAPILTTPATNAITGSNIAVKFTLPDIATDGTVKLTFAGQATTILTLTNANSTLGIHTFALNSNALASSAQVASVEGPSLLPQGIYTVTLSYQDSAGHPAAAASSTNVSIDGVSPVLSPVTVASSNANPLFARVGDTVMVTFTSNEPLQTPTVKINNVAAGVADLGGNAWRGTLLLNAASPEGSATFSVTAKDTRNNAATVTAVTDGSGVIVDRTAPMLTVPGTQTAQAAGAAGAIVNFAANATDANPVAISYSKSPGSVFPLGNTTVTATATDAAGNTTSNNFTISVQDAIPPSITILGANPVTVEAAIPYLDAGATASDAVAGDLTAAIQTTGNVNTNAVGDYAVNYTVSDGFNSATATRTVKVRDTTPPVITILGANPATVEAGTAYNDAGATAGDTLAGNISGAIQTTSNVNANAIGDYAVTYQVSDGFNSATLTRIVKVRDTIPPLITILGNDPVTVTEWPYTDAGATASDTFAGNITTSIQTQSNVTRQVGDYTIIYSVSDGQNTVTATRTVKVRDIAAPMITILGADPAIVEAGATYHDAGATANDALFGDLTAAIQTASTVNANIVGEYEVSYSVTDGSFTTAKTRSVHVVDTTGPLITHVPSPITTRADATNHAVIPDFTGDLTVTDNVAVTQTTQNPPAGTVVTFGTHTITLTIEDAEHNSSSCTTTFIVEDGPALPGRYAGLFADAQGAVHAFLGVTLTKTQVLTGYVLLDNGRRLEIPRKVLPIATHAGTFALTPGIALSLTFDGFGHVAATLSSLAAVLTADGVLSTGATSAALRGAYTVALEPGDGSAPGWLRAVVSANGLIRMSGRLPNGSMVTANQGIIVNRHGETMVFLTGQAGRSSLLAGRVYFEDLAASDVSGALTFKGAPCNASGSRFKLSTSGLPPGAYPLALTGTGVNIATTVTLRANNSARVLPPMASFVPSPAPFSPATGVFQLAFRNPASPFGPLLKGSGVFHQKLGIGMGQFKAAGATGRVELGPITSP